MASIVELREMSDEALDELIENAREEMFNLRFQNASARLADVSRIRVVRRELAQVQTVLNMRKLAIEAAMNQPEIDSVITGKEWSATAQFSYEESAWFVEFADEDENELTSTYIDLNKKRVKGRRVRSRAR
jgi:large subunit ribosomal protein L29